MVTTVLKKFARITPLALELLTPIITQYEITPTTHVLLWCSTSKNKVSEKLAKTFYEALTNQHTKVTLIIEKERLTLGPASKKTQEAILGLTKGDVFISIGSGNRGYVTKNNEHILMRTLMQTNGFRMISLGGLDSIKKNKIPAFLQSLTHDQKDIQTLNSKITPYLKKATRIRVTCPKGTNITFSLGKRPVIVNDGNWRAYSTNYPIGEVYTAPLETGAEGIAFVTSAKISGKTLLFKQPQKFIFKNGLLITTTSAQVNKNLMYVTTFNKKKHIPNWETAPRTIAEFAIGTNRSASIVGAMICDEKTFGTCHFAYGNNKHLGGTTYCHGHFDNVITNPTIWCDAKKIMENGVLLV